MIMRIYSALDPVLGWFAVDELGDPGIAGFGTTRAGAIDDLIMQIDGPPQPLAPRPKTEEWVQRVTSSPTWSEDNAHWFKELHK